MELEFRLVKGVGVIGIIGELRNTSVPGFKAEFENYLKETKNFVIDLSRLQYLDSSGLGAFVSCLRKAGEAGGDINLASLTSSVRMLFEITRAYKIFDIYDDAESAIRNYDDSRK